MIIPIDANQRFSSTENSWNLEVKITPKKEGAEPYWKAIKYYTTFSTALREACAREIRLDGAETLAEAFAAATRITGKYSGLLDGADAVHGCETKRLADAHSFAASMPDNGD